VIGPELECLSPGCYDGLGKPREALVWGAYTDGSPAQATRQGSTDVGRRRGMPAPEELGACEI